MNKILIVDDSEYKTNDIKNYLKKMNVEITNVTCGRDALLELINRQNHYDYVILDMQFPFFEHEVIERDMGIHVLSEIERKDIDTKVIMCSSNENLEKDCEKYNRKIIGYIHYDSSIYLKDNFEDLIK